MNMNKISYGQGQALGGNLGALAMTGSVVPGGGFISPTIPIEGMSEGRSVYTLLTSVFDPRTLQNGASGNRYSGIQAGFNYLLHYEDLMYRMIFDARPGRQEPASSVISDILNNICDISRMLGIYYTALTLKQSRDPQMFERARDLDLRDSFVEMQTMLADLPCPRFIAQLNSKVVRLMDVADGNSIQNVGFLVVGDYDAFVELHQAVRTRREALTWMRLLYPTLGVLGDPGSGFDADTFQLFINAHVKETDDNYCVYTKARGATGLPEQLQSAGLFHCVREPADLKVSTMTGWAVPGSGFGGVGVVRTWFPSLCTWDTSANTDAALQNTGVDVPYLSLAGSITSASIDSPALLGNIVTEYCMAATESGSYQQILLHDDASGAFSVSAISPGFSTRYRVSAGLELANLSFKYDANQLTALASAIMNG